LKNRAGQQHVAVVPQFGDEYFLDATEVHVTVADKVRRQCTDYLDGFAKRIAHRKCFVYDVYIS
jgi:hypothetical protein